MTENRSGNIPPALPPTAASTPADQSPPTAPVTAPPRRGCLKPLFITVAIISISLVLLLAVAGIAMLSNSPGRPHFSEKYLAGEEYSDNKIAVIDISGIILTDGAGGKVASARTICEQLRYAVRKDSNVKAIILRINSPGGGVVASDIIHHTIVQLRQQYQLPIIAVMESVAASGGYYVAVGCDYIIANRLTITGSIGVIAHSYNYHKLLGKIGVSSKSFKSGNMKDMLNPEQPRNPLADAIMQRMINSTYEEFLKVVAAGRKALTVDKIRNSIIGDSRILSGSEAYRLKLIDQLGYFDDAVALAAKRAKLGSDYVVVRYETPFSLSDLWQFSSPVKKLTVTLPGKGELSAKLEPGQLYFLPEQW